MSSGGLAPGNGLRDELFGPLHGSRQWAAPRQVPGQSRPNRCSPCRACSLPDKGALRSNSCRPSLKISTASFSPRRCPPLTSAAQPKRFCSSRAAARGRPQRSFLTHQNLGFVQVGRHSVARDSSSAHSAFTAAGFSNCAPLVETITGSTPAAHPGGEGKSPSQRIMAAEYSIPVFTRPGATHQTRLQSAAHDIHAARLDAGARPPDSAP